MGIAAEGASLRRSPRLPAAEEELVPCQQGLQHHLDALAVSPHLRSLLAHSCLLARSPPCTGHQAFCQLSLSPSDRMCLYLFVHQLVHASIKRAASTF